MKRDGIGAIEAEGEFELGKRSVPAAIGQIALILLFIAFSDYKLSHAWQLWTCSVVILISNILRVVLGIYQNRFYPDHRSRWTTLFAGSIGAPALTWGVLIYLVIRHNGLTDYSTGMALLIGSGISAASVTSLSLNRKLALTFITLVLGIPFIGLLIRMEPRSFGLALIFLSYYGFLSLQIRIHQRGYRENVEKQMQIRMVVDAIPGLVSWLGPDLRYRGVNRNYAANFNTSEDSFIGQPLDFRNPDPEYLREVRGFVESAAERSTIEIHSSVKGERRWHLLAMSKCPFTREVYLACINIHALKQAQSELEQRRMHEELTSKLATLGEVTANMAHEIRNPLSSIRLSMELILKEVERDSPSRSKLRDVAERGLATCERINRIIETLRGFSRKTEGEPFTTIPLESVVQDSLELVEPYFRRRQVSIRVEPVDPKLLIECRPTEIAQVLVNLLKNAVDAAESGTGGKWVRIQAGMAEGSDRIAISITDSGSGIPEDISDRLFTPFFTTKSPDRGTGLGLSISRRIAERHGGDLRLDRSAANTTFLLLLPVRQAGESKAA